VCRLAGIQGVRVGKCVQKLAERQWQVRKFLKIAEEVLEDTNSCVKDLGMNSCEPRSFLPLVQQVLFRGNELLDGQSIKSSTHFAAYEMALERVCKELRYVEAMLKMLPKAPAPFAELQLM
jgi:hypothetical protein